MEKIQQGFTRKTGFKSGSRELKVDVCIGSIIHLKNHIICLYKFNAQGRHILHFVRVATLMANGS